MKLTNVRYIDSQKPVEEPPKLRCSGCGEGRNKLIVVGEDGAEAVYRCVSCGARTRGAICTS
jgi:uncharacterized Zn finger protein